MTSPINQSRDAKPLAWVRSIVVGSTNPVKLAAATRVIAPLTEACEIIAFAARSGVSDQPFGDEETIRGALARARAAREAMSAELGIGIEGGVVQLERDRALRTCAWAAVVDSSGREGIGGSLAMLLPPVVATLVRDTGLELGAAMDRITGEHDTKQRQGAVGILTAGLVDRQAAYEVLVTYALVPFLTPELW
jgi:inosine/xanthosine triphosphatase